MAGLSRIIWTVIILLVLLWLVGGLVIQITNAFIHLLLVIAVILLLYNLITNRKAT